MRRRWIVDASNVFGSRPDGWWRDRTAALRRLVDEVVRWHDEIGEPVLVVADGHPSAWVPEGTQHGVHLVYAHSNARDAADDEVVRVVESHGEPASLVVVTSDRTLVERVREWGAATEGAGRFLERIADIEVRRSDRAVLERFAIEERALLGRGGEARVFAIDDERVLRLPHPGTGADQIAGRNRLLESIVGGSDDVPFAVPRIISTESMDDRWVVVERRLPGTDGVAALASDGVDRTALVRSHLDATAAISRLPCPSDEYGELFGDRAIRRASFVAWATERLEASLAASDGRFGHVDARRLSVELDDAVAHDGDPVLVHLDAFLGNMLSSDDEITAVLDFGPTTIAGPAGLDPTVAVAYLAPEITPPVSRADRDTARRWAEEHGLAAALGPAERWIAAYWTGAPDDGRLQAWCRRILLPGA